VLLPAVIFGLVLGAGCQQKMADQPSYKPLERSEFFADHRSARPQVKGTVARGQLRIDTALFTGRVGPIRPLRAMEEIEGPKPQPAELRERFDERGTFVEEFPLPVDENLVVHGYHRFMIYCVMCHDVLGTGHGKIVERGYTQPPTYHSQVLREMPVGRIFAVITEGYGSMPAYAPQIPPRDRWAIVAYVKALQLSQRFPVADLPADVRQKLAAELGQPAIGQAEDSASHNIAQGAAR
jgi:mono/diheme cytochrome c family protein